MSLMRPLLLVAGRHIQSEGNAAHQAEMNGDPAEVELLKEKRHDTNFRGTSFGRWQGKFSGEYLRLAYPGGFDRYYCSDTNRGRETAGVYGLVDGDGKAVQWEPLSLLRERDSREFSALTQVEKDELMRKLDAALSDSPYYFHPFGEAPADLKDHRISPLINQISGRDINSVLWVCHGDFMKVLYARILHLTKDDWKERFLAQRAEDEVLNASLHLYTRQNPKSPSDIEPSFGWFKSICPWNLDHPSNSHHWPDSENGWVRIKRQQFSNADLLDSVAAFPQLIDRSVPEDLDARTSEIFSALRQHV